MLLFRDDDGLLDILVRRIPLVVFDLKVVVFVGVSLSHILSVYSPNPASAPSRAPSFVIDIADIVGVLALAQGFDVFELMRPNSLSVPRRS